MDQHKERDNIFKNIIRQMVKVSRSAFGLTENVESLGKHIREQNIQAVSVQKENGDTLLEIQEILGKTSRLFQTAGKAEDTSRQGREKQKLYLDEVRQLSQSIEKGASFLEAFRKSSEDIARLTQLIMDLSGRLDVLAINGAIEAARRGESGLGFNVIAREMKNLAQETALSAEKVEGIVKKFDISSRDVQNLFEVSQESLRKSRQEAGDIYNVFLDLEKYNRLVSGEVSDINQLMTSLVARNENRDKSIGRILDASEMADRQVEQVDQESEDLHRVVQNILESTGNIRLNWHDKALRSVQSIASSLKDQTSSFLSVLEQVFIQYPYIELLYVMDHKGIQIGPNVIHPDFTGQIASGGDGEDRSSRSYFKELTEGQESFISGLYVSTAVNNLCLTISVPFDKDGNRYILAADMDLESFVMQE